jgi:hypothetical protein
MKSDRSVYSRPDSKRANRKRDQARKTARKVKHATQGRTR